MGDFGHNFTAPKVGNNCTRIIATYPQLRAKNQTHARLPLAELPDPLFKQRAISWKGTRHYQIKPGNELAKPPKIHPSAVVITLMNVAVDANLRSRRIGFAIVSAFFNLRAI